MAVVSLQLGRGHLIVFLPEEVVLNEASDRIDRFLQRHRVINRSIDVFKLIGID